MAKKNGNAIKVPAEVMAEIQGALSVFKEKLSPYLSSLNPEDRRELPKMGDKTVAFVQKAVEYGLQNKELAPPYLDIGGMETALGIVMQLRELAQVLGPLLDGINDTIMLSGSEAYQGALLFYANLKVAAKARVPKANSLYEDLSVRFPGGPKKKPQQP